MDIDYVVVSQKGWMSTDCRVECPDRESAIALKNKLLDRGYRYATVVAIIVLDGESEV